jgi:hypothetical protein
MSLAEVARVVQDALRSGLVAIEDNALDRTLDDYTEAGARQEHTWLLEQSFDEDLDLQEVTALKRQMAAEGILLSAVGASQEAAPQRLRLLPAPEDALRLRLAVLRAGGGGGGKDCSSCDGAGLGSFAPLVIEDGDLQGIMGPGCGSLARRPGGDRVFTLLLARGRRLHVALKDSRACRLVLRSLEELFRLPVIDTAMF